MKKIVLGLIIIASLGAGCGKPQSQQPATSAPANTLPREFSFDQVKVGDRIEGLLVTNVEPALKSSALSANNVSLSFAGDKVVSGQLRQSDYGGPPYCLIPDAPTQAALPNLAGTPAVSSLCFDESLNSVLADKAGKKVTIAIKHYAIVVDGAIRTDLVDIK